MERLKKHHSAQPGGFSSVASVFVVLCACLLAVNVANGQSDQQTSAYCAFEDGKQLSVRYVPAQLTNKPPREGVVWAPGGSPAILFSETDLEVAGVTLPVGAYALYMIPGKEQWTMIVNKDVAAGAKYNKNADLVRIPMQTAKLGRPVDNRSVQLPCLAMKPQWCDAILHRGKDIENRSWRTRIRGRIALHASLPVGAIAGTLPVGAIAGTVEIVDCVRNSQSKWAKRGSWHWVLRNPLAFQQPIPKHGRPGIFYVRIARRNSGIRSS